MKDFGTVYCLSDRSQRFIKGIRRNQADPSARLKTIVSSGICLFLTNMISVVCDISGGNSLLTLVSSSSMSKCNE